MEQEYGIIDEIRVKPKFPVRILLKPHPKKSLIVTRNAFGPNTFGANVAEMQKPYCHPRSYQLISFREPTTAESISAIAYRFAELAKPEILNPHWLQAGRVLKTSEGVWANLPKDEKGNLITDENMLKAYLNGIESTKVRNGSVYITPNRTGLRNFGYAEYGSFEQGIQESETFAQSGLARILEHTEREAVELKDISSKANYKYDVNVCGFDPVNKPILKVVGLYSGGYIDGVRLYVCGDDWGVLDYGCAFGVLDESAEGAAQKSA